MSSIAAPDSSFLASIKLQAIKQVDDAGALTSGTRPEFGEHWICLCRHSGSLATTGVWLYCMDAGESSSPLSGREGTPTTCKNADPKEEQA
jgi:hypothetical protein